MKKVMALVVLFLITIVLASCSQSGLEKISFKEAEKKLTDTKGEYIAFIDVEDDTAESYKKLLKKVSENKKIYYVDITSEIKTSSHYQDEFTKKYPSTKDGIFITNKGKEVKDNKIFEFPMEIDNDLSSETGIEEGAKAINKFLDKEG